MTYSNVNGLITTITELNEYLKRIKPDIVGLTEIKLDKSIMSLNIGDGEYEIWQKTRPTKQGGGIMILTKKDLQVDKVTYGNNNVELVNVGIRSENKSIRNFAVMYVPPKTRSWDNIEHKELQRETLLQMEDLINH